MLAEVLVSFAGDAFPLPLIEHWTTRRAYRQARGGPYVALDRIAVESVRRAPLPRRGMNSVRPEEET